MNNSKNARVWVRDFLREREDFQISYIDFLLLRSQNIFCVIEGSLFVC